MCQGDISYRFPVDSDQRRGLLGFLRSQEFPIFLWVLQQAFGLLQLTVGTESCLNGTCLIKIVGDDVILQNLQEHGLVLFQIEGHIVVQLLLQIVESRLGIIVIALKLSCLHQLSELFLADGIIGKAALDDTSLELLPIGFRQMELGWFGYRRNLAI